MSDEMNMRKVIEILTRYSKMISEIDGDCFSPDAIREINLIFLGQQFLKSLPTLKPSGRTVQEIRSFVEKAKSNDFRQNNPCYDYILEFIDSGESDDVCRWYRFNNIRHKWYTDCRVDIEGHQEITAKICICGRKIKREE